MNSQSATRRTATPDSMVYLAIGAVLVSCGATRGWSQRPTAAEPTVGLRSNPPSTTAMTGARIVVGPGRAIDNATLIIQGSSIKAVGDDVSVPDGARVVDCSGKTIYPGLIDAWGEADVELENSGKKQAYWNSNVTPQRSTRGPAGDLPGDAEKRRSQGFTARLVAPQGNIVKGTGCVSLLGGPKGHRLLAEDVCMHLQLTVPRDRSSGRSRYPNSPMGAIALLRQSLLDAKWYGDAWNVYRSQPGVPRPEENLALAILSEASATLPFVIDAPNERMAIRAGDLAGEFSLRAVLRGSGREYRRLTEIAEQGRPILVPVAFPDPPSVTAAEEAAEVTLRELMHWRLAPENPARLSDAGVRLCLTTDGLDDPSKFLDHVRTAIEHGLDEEAALAGVTTIPAELFGVSNVVGKIAAGMLANLVVTDGDLFDEKTKVTETWVAGERYEIETPPRVDGDRLAGTWQLKLEGVSEPFVLVLEQSGRQQKLTGQMMSGETRSTDDEPPSSEQSDDASNDETKQERPSAKLQDLVRHRDRVTATVDLSEITDEDAVGNSRLTLVIVSSDDAERPTLFMTLVGPDGREYVDRLEFLDENAALAQQETPEGNDEEKVATTQDGETTSSAGDESSGEQAAEDEEIAVNFPLGAFGYDSQPEQVEAVLFRNATVWTCADESVLENADVLVHRGVIAAVGPSLDAPADCRVIDATGKHITPGLIDCHSHMATDGGVNESGQAVTAEVRIGDFIDNSDINIYRQLAGGLTTSNILHGSANPIGGQNQVIKLRWGQSMDDLRFERAPAGIKFALGENVKRSRSRYPNTRMGVEQIIRDQLLAAREYDSRRRRWREGNRDSLPPRRDLQLEALAEVQSGDRWIHCHSYRQDEIVATLEVLEEFNIQIGTLQHILEGYKVADKMAEHGAMASAFSDWWAYKFEVYDAIPYNGVLMHEAGVVVSFNSDDRELARHLNTEAAKAVKYGGVSAEEALKFVTLNPAKQLRIDDHVGSLEAGKDADLVIWSGPPLSTTTRCEQTWIDGRRYFSLEQDQRLRERDAAWRARLIQLAMDEPAGDGDKQDQQSEEDRWLRYDVFCNALGGEAATR